MWCFILFVVYGVHKSSVYVVLSLSLKCFQLQGQMWKVPRCCKKQFKRLSESDGARKPQRSQRDSWETSSRDSQINCSWLGVGVIQKEDAWSTGPRGQTSWNTNATRPAVVQAAFSWWLHCHACSMQLTAKHFGNSGEQYVDFIDEISTLSRIQTSQPCAWPWPFGFGGTMPWASQCESSPTARPHPPSCTACFWLKMSICAFSFPATSWSVPVAERLWL